MTSITKMAANATLTGMFLLDHADFLEEWSYDNRCNGEAPYESLTWAAVYGDSYTFDRVEICCHGPQARLFMRRAAKEIGGKWDKDTDEISFRLTRTLEDGLKVSIEAPRKLVCTPRVVDTKEVEVIDYDQPMPKKIVTQDVIEWDCPSSLLEVIND